MFGKTKQALLNMGLQASGNSYYGALYGYETNASINLYGMIFIVSMHRTPDQQSAIQHDLLVLKTKFINWQWNNYGITLSITDWTQKTMLKKLETLLQSIYQVFEKNGALGVGYCPVCGKALDFDSTKKCLIDGAAISIDNDCVDKINAAISADNEQFDAAPNNYFKGFCGALIGGIAGAAVSVVLAILGFISAISVFVAFFVGILLYKKFGGKPNKMMLVIVTATTFVCMIASILGIYLTVCAIGAAEAAWEGVEITTVEYFKLMMSEQEFAREFWSNIAMTALFTVVGCVLEIINHARKIKRQKNI